MTEKEVALAGGGKPRFYYGYVVVIAAFLIMLVFSGALSSYGVFFKPLAGEFGWNRAEIAGAYSLSLFLTGLLFMITGRLTDRFGPRAVATICCFFLALSLFLMSQLNSLWQLYLFFGVIFALGLSGGLVPMMTTVSRWFKKRRGLITGVVVAGVGVGQVIVPPLATHFIDSYGWRNTYIIMSVVTIVVGMIVAQFLRRDPSQVGQLPDGASEVKPADAVAASRGFSFKEAFKTRQLWMICGMYFCYGFMVHPTLVHIIPHATDMGISAIAAASVLSVIGGMSTAGRIVMGSTGDRLGIRRGIAIAFILAVVAFAWLQISGELWMLFIFAVFFGFAYGGLVSLESPLAAELFGLKEHGAILGMIHFSATIGSAISSPFAGRLFDVTGSYQHAFITYTLLGCAGLVITLILRVPGRRVSEDN